MSSSHMKIDAKFTHAVAIHTQLSHALTHSNTHPQAKIVLFLASTDYVAILGHEAPYQIVIVEAVQRVVANAALTQQDFLGVRLEVLCPAAA